MSDSGASHIETLKFEQSKLSRNSNGITFHTDVDSSTSHIQMLEIEQRKLSRHSNGHNVSHAGQIQTHNISRRLKLNNETHKKFKWS